MIISINGDEAIIDGKVYHHAPKEEKSDNPHQQMIDDYATGNYICVFKFSDNTTTWEIAKDPRFKYEDFDYRLIHNKDKDVLYAWLADNNVEIEVETPVGWDICPPFIEHYNKDENYRLAEPQCDAIDNTTGELVGTLNEEQLKQTHPFSEDKFDSDNLKVCDGKLNKEPKKMATDFKLVVKDISSICSYMTECYSIVGVDDEEAKYDVHYYFDNYKTWELIINRVNYFRRLVTQSTIQYSELRALEDFLITYLNKCDYCSKYMPECELPDVEFGKGFGLDNVISCSAFLLKEPNKLTKPKCDGKLNGCYVEASEEAYDALTAIGYPTFISTYQSIDFYDYILIKKDGQIGLITKELDLSDYRQVYFNPETKQFQDEPSAKELTIWKPKKAGCGTGLYEQPNFFKGVRNDYS